ncbi:flagellar assembly protein FlaJ [Sporosarcina sp. resist]|uniref:flagellar assembly protein FlaJ n=1 Tax=Sporosarcina sp. resist TaxID=2762563 RepID=UPI00164D0318|nr:flagellar assembly protein FlaJ [Sporosarcina sp. resist]QNK89092.1 flagellar assembly protein FlaJ [Sporosarcina sp. resist]
MLAELWKEQQLEGYLSYFKREKKSFTLSRLIFGVIITFLFLIIILMTGKNLLYIATPVAFFVGYKYAYFNLMMSRRKMDLMNAFLFPEFLQSFMALLSSSGNVYQTLKQSVTYTSEPLKSELEKLVLKIEDGNKRNDYLTFAEYISSSEAYMIMDMIYQFSEFGVKKEALQELDLYIQNLQENKIDDLIVSKMGAMDNFGMIPILIALFLTGGFAGVVFMFFMGDLTGALNVMP